MTAGRGVVHSEMPNPETVGLQLWVNLQSSDKMVPPAYQEHLQASIPVAISPDGLVSAVVIAGKTMDIQVNCYEEKQLDHNNLCVKRSIGQINSIIGSPDVVSSFAVKVVLLSFSLPFGRGHPLSTWISR